MNAAFGEPCLVTATEYSNFLPIIEDAALRLPTDLGLRTGSEDGSLEGLFGLGNSVFLSAGFQYNAMFPRRPVGFIFDPGILDDDFLVFGHFVVSLIHKSALRFWATRDPAYLASLVESDAEVEKYVLSYFATESMLPAEEKIDGGSFEFWHIKKQLFERFRDYPRIDEATREIRATLEETRVCSRKAEYVRRSFEAPYEYRSEICCMRELPLDDPSLIGLYIAPEYLTERTIDVVASFLARSRNIDTRGLRVFDGDGIRLIGRGGR